ncbi:MAG TPA: CHASE2 domain-containing protein, partial [Aggregatilineales bacterium]|nr:CHASE2 domain-containing protein [Aggregatilineales bacterium]
MTALNHAARRFSPALRPLVLALAVGLLAAMLGGGVLHRLELFTGDVLFRLRGPLHDDSGIVLVAIDDASFAHNDLQWPWPRSYLARIVD